MLFSRTGKPVKLFSNNVGLSFLTSGQSTHQQLLPPNISVVHLVAKIVNGLYAK